MNLFRFWSIARVVKCFGPDIPSVPATVTVRYRLPSTDFSVTDFTDHSAALAAVLKRVTIQQSNQVFIAIYGSEGDGEECLCLLME